MNMFRLALISLVFGLNLITSGFPVQTIAYSQLQKDANEGSNDRVNQDVQDSRPLNVIYIPFEDLQATFEKEGRGVYLPYEDFQKLWRQAQANQVSSADVLNARFTPKSLISEIESRVYLEDQIVKVDAILTINLLKKGWHRIPLRLSDAAIRQATINDVPARIIANQRREYELVVEHQSDTPENVKLEISYAKTFSKVGGQSAVSFKSPQSSINRWIISTDSSDIDLQIDPAIATTKRKLNDDDTQANENDIDSGNGSGEEILAFVGSADEVKISWIPRSQGAAGLESLIAAQITTTINVDPSVSRTRAEVELEISRAAIDAVSLILPADQKIVNVFDKNIKRWTIEESDDEQLQIVKVEFFEGKMGSQAIEIELERFIDQDSSSQLVIPQIAVQNASRNSGVAVVKLSSELRGEPLTRSGAMQIDASELPEKLKSLSWDFAFRYAAVPFELSLSLREVKPLINAQQLVEVIIEPERMNVNFVSNFDVQLAGVFQLEFRIPVDFEIREFRMTDKQTAQPASVDGFYRHADDPTCVVVTMNRKMLGRFTLQAQLEKKFTDTNLQKPTEEPVVIDFPLPQIDRQGIEYSQGNLVVYAPAALQINARETTGLQAESFGNALAPIRSVVSSNGHQKLLAYRFAHDDAAIAMHAKRRLPQITVEQLVTVAVQAGSIQYDSRLFFEVMHSGVRSLRLDVPSDLIGQLRNRSPNINFQAFATQPEDVRTGFTALELTSDAEFLGEREVRFTWEQRFNELGLGEESDFNVLRLIPQQVDNATGQVVLMKSETIDLSLTGDAVGLRPIDAQEDLAQGIEIPNAAMAFAFANEWDLSVLATRFDLQELKQTSISRALIRVISLRQNELSVQCLYQVRSVRQRLGLIMPDGFDPAISFDDSPIRINGQRVTPERGDLIYIPLAGQNPDEPFLLEIRYTIPGTADEIELPVFADDPAIQKTYLAVYLPFEKALINFHGPWSDGAAAELQAQRVGSDTRTPFSFLNRLFNHPTPNISGLITWVGEGVETDLSAIEKFDVDGRPYLFAAVRPEPPPSGNLRLQMMEMRWINILVCGGLVLIGLLLLRSTATAKIAVGLLVVAALIFAGNVFPLVTEHLMGDAFWATFGLIAIVWFSTSLLRLTKSKSRTDSAGQRSRQEYERSRRPSRSGSTEEPLTINDQNDAKTLTSEHTRRKDTNENANADANEDADANTDSGKQEGR